MKMTTQIIKINIIDDCHLNAVRDVIESMKYVKVYSAQGQIRSIITDTNGGYLEFNRCSDSNKTSNISDLLKMRDEKFMEKLHVYQYAN